MLKCPVCNSEQLLVPDKESELLICASCHSEFTREGEVVHDAFDCNLLRNIQDYL